MPPRPRFRCPHFTRIHSPYHGGGGGGEIIAQTQHLVLIFIPRLEDDVEAEEGEEGYYEGADNEVDGGGLEPVADG